MATLYTHQDENIAKTWILMAGFLCVVILIGWAISYYFQSPIILLVAVIFAFAVNIWSYWNSDKVVIRMSGAKPADPAQYPQLYRVVENLAITAGLPQPKIYIIQDPAPNAFATGRNKKSCGHRSHLPGKLLSMMDDNELFGRSWRTSCRACRQPRYLGLDSRGDFGGLYYAGRRVLFAL